MRSTRYQKHVEFVTVSLMSLRYKVWVCTCTVWRVIGCVCCLRHPSAAQGPGPGKSLKGQASRASHSWGVTQGCRRDESQELEPSLPWPQTPSRNRMHSL